jgi:hypothetical protein
MIKEAAPESTTLLSRGDRLALVFVATPFFGICSFVAIAVICDLVDYNLFGAVGWGMLPWGVSQFLACVALTLALALSEGSRAGGLGTYTALGTSAGVGSLFFLGVNDFGQVFWIPLLQYGLIGHLLGRIAYRGVNRPASAPDSTSSAKEKSEKET